MDSLFENYTVVKYLKDHEHSFYAVIKELYEICKSLLAEIPKTFSNYTIHDIGHSVRVIGYMDALVKDRVDQFSALQLMLIVCVGLLHDVGMVVSDDEMEILYHEFESKNSAFRAYNDDEKRVYLQNYVRKKHGERVAKMIERPINQDTKIKSLFYVGDTKSYDISGLITTICRSHTENCDWIEGNLNQKYYYGNYEINPQHIALLLRIGDALDIDDRRAPYVLYQLLNPKGISDDEWRKHIPITNYDKIHLKGKEYSIIFSGECREPEIYRKILDYIDLFKKDLKKASTIWTKFESIYQLNISNMIEVAIKTNGFMATHLMFNLEYRQISKLLMGEKIYGSKKDGLRELLQNSIDAVLLMYEIEQKNPYPEYLPIVGIEIDEEARKIVVFDNGVGMSRRILQDYFFNIGNSYYVSDEFKNGEYLYQPIGHFGIGFLACFMLSSKIRMETKHYKEKEMFLMDFESNSSYVTRLNGEGQHPLEHGTRIILDYDQIIPEIFSDKENLYSYLKELLVAGDYKMMFIQNGKKEVQLQKLGKMDFSDGGRTEFSYTINRHVDIQFDILKFFENNENVYIVDDDLLNNTDFYYSPEYFSLAYYEEIISNLEAEYQTEKITWEEIIDRLPDSLSQWLYTNDFEIHNVKRNKDIYILLEKYINSFLQNNTLTWYELPVIYKKSIFNSFLETIEKEGKEKALKHYKSDMQYLYVLSRKPISNRVFLHIMQNRLEMWNDSDDSFDFSYYDRYPLQPISKTIQLLDFPGTNSYLRVTSDVLIPKSKVYLKGIRVMNETIILPFAIAGIDIENVTLNICSANYDTDVARSSFDIPSREKIQAKVAKMIYADVMQNAEISLFEKQMIERFLNFYYV